MDINNIDFTEEKDRPNSFTSTQIFARATVFYPSSRITATMKTHEELSRTASDPIFSNVITVPVNGESATASYKIDMYGRILLQSHRDILETIISHGDHMALNEEKFGKSDIECTWEGVFKKTFKDSYDGNMPRMVNPYLPSDSHVFSISFYELATRLGISHTKSNYEMIRERLKHIMESHLVVNTLDENGAITFTETVKFIDRYVLYTDKSKYKGRKFVKSDNYDDTTNHVFIVPEYGLVQSIRDHGYIKRSDRPKLKNYTKPPIRSFIMFLMSHKDKFINTKKLDWVIDEYIGTMSMKVSHAFKSTLRNDIKACRDLIHEDFGIEIVDSEKGTQLFIPAVIEND